jgi:hypothetical protein
MLAPGGHQAPGLALECAAAGMGCGLLAAGCWVGQGQARRELGVCCRTWAHQAPSGLWGLGYMSIAHLAFS